MALVVFRSRHLSEDYVKAERARANLARHFSPNVVDQLATDDEPFGPVRRQDIAVLFADIVGFTHYSEDHPAEAVFELLRQFHRRMEQVVFDHHGTVDNYIGDCIMATFGVPQASHDDATRAIQCAEAMVAALEDWNVQRVSRGYPPLDVRIGAQYGAVVIGAVGSERNLSFAVVGDTVNVASRLQSLCRELRANICFGSGLIDAAKAESPTTQLNARDHGPVSIRGRDEPVHVWIEHRAENQGAVSA
nr:adenylate/guanylate cyclase domain-containing protein [Mesorhizobium sangaii]